MGISIAYSTRQSNPQYKKYLKSLTTLKDVEILEYENPGTYSLTQIYNKALEESSNAFVILIHDDLELERGFDKKIASYFNNSDYGILGIAGTTKLTKEGVWWQNLENEINWAGQVWHQQKIKDQNGVERLTPKYKSLYSDKFPNEILPAVCVDGLFIAVNKEKATSHFNESITGFHFYDISFCVDNFVNGVKIGIITDLYCFHKSIGQLSEQWHINRALFLAQYVDKLPIEVIPNIKSKITKSTHNQEISIGIVILSKNNFEYLNRCIASIQQKSKYTNYTIYIGDTGSNDETLNNIKTLLTNNIKLIELEKYNFSQNNNEIVFNHVEEPLILFCNDDIELINDPISQMISFYLQNKKQKKIGTIGAKLFYGNNRIQHAGVYISLKDQQFRIGHLGIHSYYGKNDDVVESIANTGAFLMMETSLFKEIGGFPYTENCFEDVLLNLECTLRGRKNYMVGQAHAYHFESISRKKEGLYQEKIQNDMKAYLLPYINKHVNRLKF